MEKMTANETVLTQKQIEVLKLRKEGHSQEEIAKKFGKTKQNISAIERMARRKVKRAENTVKFTKLLEAPIWFAVDKNTNIDDVAERVFSEADRAKIHMVYDSLSLAMKIRENAGNKIKHRVILREFEIGVTKEGEILIV
jgi:DNA-binding protein, Tfx family